MDFCWNMEGTHLYPRLFILSLNLKCYHTTHEKKGVSTIVRKKCQGWYSQCRSDRLIYRPLIIFTMHVPTKQTFVLKEPMVILAKTEGAGCRPEFRPIRKNRGREKGPPWRFKQTVWKVTRKFGYISERLRGSRTSDLRETKKAKGC
ncbi:hypothetical protein TNCV_4922201 [Trichonephila clavipes]|nr:hypothetical protein TNCV_4922201 [Trichonephila clavipes]